MPSHGPIRAPSAPYTADTPVSVACTIGRPVSAARSAASEACCSGAQLRWNVDVDDCASSTPAPSCTRWRLMSGNAVSKHTIGPIRRPSPTAMTTCSEPRLRSSPAAFPTDVAQPSSERAGTYSPNGTSRILSYRSPVGPSGPINTELL